MKQSIKRQRQLPISEYQKRFFFEWALAPYEIIYNVSYVHKITGNFQEKAFKSACEMFTNHNEVVHARFSEDGNECYYGDFHIDQFFHESSFDPGKPIQTQISEFLYKPFDLTTGPILRLHLLKSSDVNTPEYYFFFVTHHIICDAIWILQLYSQIQHAYKNILEGNTISINTGKTFTEAVEAEQKILNQAYKANAQKFWLEFIGDVPLHTSLPYQANHSAIDLNNPLPAKTGEFIYFDLNSVQSAQLRACAAQNGTTLFVVLSALYGLVLAKYINQEKFFFSYSVSARFGEFKEVPGCFMNNVPMKFELDKVHSLGMLIKVLNEQRKLVKPYQGYTLTDIVHDQRKYNSNQTNNALNIGFAQSYLNVVDFDLQDAETLPVDITWSTSSIYEIGLLYDERSPDAIRFKLEYRIFLFDKYLINRFISSFKKALNDLVDSKEVAINNFSVLSHQEYEQVIYKWNATYKEFSRDRTIYQLFEAQVEKTPDRIALVYEEQELSYKELNEKSNQLARHIRDQYQQRTKQALAPDTLIALCVDRSLEMIIGILAILKAGGAYVPVDPYYPQERMDYILEDTKAALLLTQRQLTNNGNVQLPEGKVIYIDVAEDLYQNEDGANLPPYSTFYDLAYVIYTSGTTGKPKGVMLHHSGIVNRIEWMQSMYPLNGDDVVLQKTPYVFDVSVWELLWANWYGAKIVLAKPEEHKDSEYLHQLIQKNKITTLHFVPGMLEAYNQYLSGQHCKFNFSLRQVFCSGEALAEHVVNRTYQNITHPSFRLHNLYGPTESSIDVTFFETSPGRKVYIGKPIQNTQLYVLDQNRIPVPIGVIGELYIGGAGVARGYLNNEALTAERFIVNPFGTESDKAKGYTRLYRTGDLVRWQPGGELEYIGRNDEQVKIRGYRVELGEIEHVLLQIPGIAQSCVVVKERQTESGSSKYLAGYYVLDDGQEAPGEDIILEQLTAVLPDYMVPGILIPLASFPLTINGKLDKGALPDPDFSSAGKEYVGPTTETEAALCRIWQEVLGLENIGITDDFFRIGGDSILSIQVSGRIRKAGFNCQVKDIFLHKTIEKLSRDLSKRVFQAAVQSEQGILTGSFGLLPVQQWFTEQVDRGAFAMPNHWNQSFLIKVARLDKNKLTAIVEELAGYHDVLRVQYIKAQQWQQVYRSAIEIPELKTIDVSQHSPEEVQQILTDWQSIFDLEKGPLFQAGYLYGYEDGSARIYLALHHMIVDAVSWRILTEDIKTLYEGKALPSKGSSYRQWTERIKVYPEQYPAERSYWQEQLKGMPDYYVPKEEQTKPSVAFLKLNKTLTSSLLQKASKAYHTQINDLLLTALAYALKDINGQHVQGITLEGHGREAIDSSIDHSHTVGWFTSMFPVRLEIQNTLRESIQCIKEMMRSIPNKGIGFGSFAVEKGSAYTQDDLPVVSFNYLGQFDTAQGDWQIVAEGSGMGMHPSNKDHNQININGMVSNGELGFSIVSRLGDQSTIQLGDSLKGHLELIIEHCEKKLSGEGSSHTPSDFKTVQLSQSVLDSLHFKAKASKNEVVQIYPANSLQQGFIYHALSQGEDDAYRVQVLYDYHEAIEVDKYKKAWEMCIEQYPILRTAFNWEEDIIQIIYKEGKLDYQVHDISDLATQEAKDIAIESLQVEDRKKSFDLTGPTLLRVHIIKQAADYYTLIKSEHHSISDGWSGPILLASLHKYYQSLKAGRKVSIKEDTAYVAAQEYISSNKERIADYWQTTLGEVGGANDINPLLSELIDAGSYRQVRQQATSTLELSGDIYKAIKSFSQAEGITVNVIVQFMWHKLLQVYSSSSKTIVGTTVSGRDLPVEGIENSVGLYINTLPLVVDWENDNTILVQMQQIQQQVTGLNTHSFAELAKLQRDGERLFQSLVVFENYPVPESNGKDTPKISRRNVIEKMGYPITVLAYEDNDILTINLQYDSKHLTHRKAAHHIETLRNTLEQIIKNPQQLHVELSLVSEGEYERIIHEWNATDKQYPRNKTVYELFEEQAERSPESIALVYEEEALSYRELNEKSNQLGRHIRAQYLQRTKQELAPDTLVALCLDRSLEMVIGILAVLKAGGAYVPVDPGYPQERVDYLLEDTQAAVVLKGKSLPENSNITLPKNKTINIDLAETIYQNNDVSNLRVKRSATDLAYVIYTSGTTGKPKGVMVEHLSLTNFLFAMNDALQLKTGDHILSITSISFDISILELLWSLTKGMSITLKGEQEHISNFNRSLNSHTHAFDFSLFYFSSQENANQNKYGFLKESASYADKNDFSAIWLPERHFHEFGGIFPNPSVLGAGISTITEKIEIRSGSIVLPLHDVIRVAEEWSVVDNLSNGRVALSIAPGWHSNDFVLKPENFHDRHKIMYGQIEDLKVLWQGGSIKRVNGINDQVDIKIYPKPVTANLTIYLTTAGNSETFISAGRIGANILTHMLGQDIHDLESKIKLYQKSLRDNGFSVESAKIALMLHTYIGKELMEVKEIVREPFMAYLKSSVGLVQSLAKDLDVSVSNLSKDEFNNLIELVFERYWKTSALLGTPDSCKKLLSSIYDIGVTEIACLVDFGIEDEKVIEGLKHLNELKNNFQKDKRKSGNSVTVTALQITPSYLEALVKDGGSASFLKSLKHIIVGGENFPAALLNKLGSLTDADIYNMYGPTETTIWSTFKKLKNGEKVTIGKPIQNTQIYVLDRYNKLCPIGVTGELSISGDGVARGYLNNQDLTNARFLPNPFATASSGSKTYARMYKTGDLARWLPNGNLEYIGRNDEQLKIRGYRIELGEIEHALTQIPGIKQSCVIAKKRQTESGSTTYLVGYYVVQDKVLTEQLTEAFLLNKLSAVLPGYMLPVALLIMESFPLKISGKLDKQSFPEPDISTSAVNHISPTTATEVILCNIWQEILRVEKISTTDSFFRIGGDSILSIQVAGRIRQAGFNCQVNDIFLYETIERLAQHISSSPSDLVTRSEQGLLTGTFELLPIQQWFTDRMEKWAAPSHFNQSFLVKVPPLIEHTLGQAIEALVDYHDVLRIRLLEDDGWKQCYRSNIEIPRLKVLDVGQYSSKEVQEILTDWQSSFDLKTGHLFQAGYLFGYEDGSARIYFACHHLIIDGVSWRIITEDIKSLYEGNNLPAKGSSYRQWVKSVRTYPSHLHLDERSYWKAQLAGLPAYEITTEKLKKPTSAFVELDKIVTASLLQKAPAAYLTEVNDLLLTALAYSLKDINGKGIQGITLEGHGREAIDPSIDHSRIVGWFTSMFPVKLQLQNTLKESIQRIKEDLRMIPNKGIGFGFFATEKDTSFTHDDLPPIIFNYLGQFDNPRESWQVVAEASGLNRHPLNIDCNVININGMVSNSRLGFSIITQLGEETTMDLANSFIKHLTIITEHCVETSDKFGIGYTPSDFKAVQLSQSLLDELQIEMNNF